MFLIDPEYYKEKAYISSENIEFPIGTPFAYDCSIAELRKLLPGRSIQVTKKTEDPSAVVVPESDTTGDEPKETTDE